MVRKITTLVAALVVAFVMTGMTNPVTSIVKSKTADTSTASPMIWGSSGWCYIIPSSCKKH